MTVASSSKPTTADIAMQDSLELLLDDKAQEQALLIEERNSVFVTEEVQKIEGWAEDNRKSLQGKLKQLDKDIETLDSEFVKERNIRKKLAIQQQKDALSSKRDEAWREFDSQREELKKEKNKLIENLYTLADQQSEVVDSFIIRWRIK